MGSLAGHLAREPAMVIPAPGFDPRFTLKATADEQCTIALQRCRPCSSPNGA